MTSGPSGPVCISCTLDTDWFVKCQYLKSMIHAYNIWISKCETKFVLIKSVHPRLGRKFGLLRLKKALPRPGEIMATPYDASNLEWNMSEIKDVFRCSSELWICFCWLSLLSLLSILSLLRLSLLSSWLSSLYNHIVINGHQYNIPILYQHCYSVPQSYPALYNFPHPQQHKSRLIRPSVKLASVFSFFRS